MIGETLLAAGATGCAGAANRTIGQRKAISGDRRIPRSICDDDVCLHGGVCRCAVASGLGTHAGVLCWNARIRCKAGVAVAIGHVPRRLTKDVTCVLGVAAAIDDGRARPGALPACLRSLAIVSTAGRALGNAVIDAVVRGNSSVIPTGEAARTRLTRRTGAAWVDTNVLRASGIAAVAAWAIERVRAFSLAAGELGRARSSESEEKQSAMHSHDRFTF